MQDAPHVQIIQRWLNGSIRNAKPNQVEAVIRAWEAHPQCEFLVLNDEQRAEIVRLMTDTGVGFVALLRGQRAKAPEGLTAVVIRGMLEKPNSPVRRDHYEWVLRRWREMQALSRSLVTLTKKQIGMLMAEAERTGIKAGSLLARAADPPVSAATVYSWLYGKTRTARVSDFEYVLSLWRSMPDAGQIPLPGQGAAVRIPLTQEIVAELQAMKEKSGLGPIPLFEWAAKQGISIPPGVSAQALGACMRFSNKTVDPQLLSFALETWRAALAYAARPVPIEGWARTSLLRSRDVGFLSERLFEGAIDVPEGLNAGVVSGWLDGCAPEAQKNHLDWVLKRCKALSNSEMPRVMITEDVRAALIAYKERTGVGASALLKGARDTPAGLSASLVTAWIGGYVGSARKDYLDYVIARWKALPDAEFTSAYPGFRD